MIFYIFLFNINIMYWLAPDVVSKLMQPDIVTEVLAGWEARCNSMIRAIAHGAMGRRIDPSWV